MSQIVKETRTFTTGPTVVNTPATIVGVAQPGAVATRVTETGATQLVPATSAVQGSDSHAPNAALGNVQVTRLVRQ